MMNITEVKGMLLTEWDWEKEKIKLANTERNAGIKEGIRKGKIKGESKAYKDMYSLMEKCDSFDEFKKEIEKKIK